MWENVAGYRWVGLGHEGLPGERYFSSVLCESVSECVVFVAPCCNACVRSTATHRKEHNRPESVRDHRRTHACTLTDTRNTTTSHARTQAARMHCMGILSILLRAANILMWSVRWLVASCARVVECVSAWSIYERHVTYKLIERNACVGAGDPGSRTCLVGVL